MLDFLLKNPCFLQARLDKKIPIIFRICLILFFYVVSLITFIFKIKLYKIFLVLFIILSILEIYFFSRKNQQAKTPYEKIKAINYDLAVVFLNSKEFSPQEIFESLLKNKDVQFVLEKIELSPDILKSQIKFSTQNLSEEDFKLWLSQISLWFNNQKIILEPLDVFFFLIKSSDDFLKILNDFHISLKDIGLIIDWYNHYKASKKFNLFALNPIGVAWSAGYTPFLDNFSSEITKQQTQKWHSFLHQDLIKQIVLSIHNGRLPVIIGKVGSGRRSVILSLVKILQEGKLTSYLNFRRVLEFYNEDFVAKFIQSGEVSKFATALFNETASSGNIFLVITDIDKTPQIIESLVPFIGVNNFVAVATATAEGIEKISNFNKDFLTKIDKIFLSQLKEEDILLVLMDKAWEAQNMVSFQALKKIMDLSDKFDPYLNEPLRSINYLNEVISFNASSYIGVKEVENFFSSRFNVALGTLKKEEQLKLLNFEDLFHQEMVDQNEAISKIANALKSARLGLTDSKRPITSMLFLGPTGVGKTTSAKLIAKLFFESEDFLVRLDLNEYSDAGGILRLINRESGANSFIANVKKNARGVLLLDEIEKAHKVVKDALLQMLDEGYLSDSNGEKVFFNNYIIIATSNAASEFIRENITKLNNDDDFYNNLKEKLLKEGIFTPEFLNRFDYVVAFKPLSLDDATKLAKMILKNLQTKIKEERNINIDFSEKFILEIVSKGFSPEWGARQLKRVIKDEVEPLISQKIIEGSLKEGDRLKL